MPSGVQSLRRDGKSALLGHLSYYRIQSSLCSLCQDMQSAVAGRTWFVEAHHEYLRQIELKKQLMSGK
jgi:hypothetical protein